MTVVDITFGVKHPGGANSLVGGQSVKLSFRHEVSATGVLDGVLSGEGIGYNVKGAFSRGPNFEAVAGTYTPSNQSLDGLAGIVSDMSVVRVFGTNCGLN